MSVQAISWAMAQRTGNGTRKAVLVALANCHNHHTGKCFPKVSTLAGETELHDRTVRRALNELQELGFILKFEVRRADGSQGPSRYMLRMDRASEQTDTAPDGQTDTAPDQEPEVNLEPSEPNGSGASTKILQRKNLEELWGACETYVQTSPTAKSPRAAYAKLVRELHDAGWTPQDVEVRAEAYRKHPTFSKCELTLAALAKWGETFQTETQTREARMQAVYRKAGMV